MRCSCSFASASRRRRACSRNFRVASEPSGWNIPAVRLRVAPPPVGVAAIISSLMPAIVTRRYRGREGLWQQRDRIGILARFTGWFMHRTDKGDSWPRRAGFIRAGGVLGRRPGLIRALRGSAVGPTFSLRARGVLKQCDFRSPSRKSAPLRTASRPGPPEIRGCGSPASAKVVQICRTHRASACTSAPPLDSLATLSLHFS